MNTSENVLEDFVTATKGILKKYGTLEKAIHHIKEKVQDQQKSKSSPPSSPITFPPPPMDEPIQDLPPLPPLSPILEVKEESEKIQDEQKIIHPTSSENSTNETNLSLPSSLSSNAIGEENNEVKKKKDENSLELDSKSLEVQESKEKKLIHSSPSSNESTTTLNVAPIGLNEGNQNLRSLSPSPREKLNHLDDGNNSKDRSPSVSINTVTFHKKMAEAKESKSRKEKSPKKKTEGKKGFGKLFSFKREKEEDKKEKQEIMAFLYGNE